MASGVPLKISCDAREPWAGAAPPSSLQDAPLDLVEFHRLEERLEVALPEALISLALDDLEEDRADNRLGEDLQQAAARRAGGAVDLDLGGAQPLQILPMTGQPRIDNVVIA